MHRLFSQHPCWLGQQGRAIGRLVTSQSQQTLSHHGNSCAPLLPPINLIWASCISSSACHMVVQGKLREGRLEAQWTHRSLLDWIFGFVVPGRHKDCWSSYIERGFSYHWLSQPVLLSLIDGARDWPCVKGPKILCDIPSICYNN